MEELEAGGEIEDLDLTSEEWVNVNPADITKRYEMLRRYVCSRSELKEIYDLSIDFCFRRITKSTS